MDIKYGGSFIRKRRSKQVLTWLRRQNHRKKASDGVSSLLYTARENALRIGQGTKRESPFKKFPN